MDVLVALVETGKATSALMESVTYVGYNGAGRLRWFYKDTDKEIGELSKANFESVAFKPYHPKTELCEACRRAEVYENREENRPLSIVEGDILWLLKQVHTCKGGT